MTLQSHKRNNGSEREQAFTLIELILVLALLAIATSFAAPALSGFFRSRALNSEARQLLSLTHAGQARAVSSGFPMVLWFDEREHTYGLQEEGTVRSGNSFEVDPRADEFPMHEKLKVEVFEGSSVAINGSSLPGIRFLPDGTVDEESPIRLRIVAENGEALWLLQASNRMNYEIRYSDR